MAGKDMERGDRKGEAEREERERREGLFFVVLFFLRGFFLTQGPFLNKNGSTYLGHQIPAAPGVGVAEEPPLFSFRDTLPENMWKQNSLPD